VQNGSKSRTSSNRPLWLGTDIAAASDQIEPLDTAFQPESHLFFIDPASRIIQE
jgi:hypothetical protein